MSFTNATDIKARYTDFASVADSTIDLYLAEADLYVDTIWPENLRAHAQGLYVAHLMAVDGLGASATGASTVAGQTTPYLSEIEGFLKFDLPSSGSNTTTTRINADSSLDDTAYGRRFRELRMNTFGGGQVV